MYAIRSYYDSRGAQRYGGATMTERRQLILAGLLSLGCGLGICLVALRVVPVDEASVHAPDWVILLAGGVFVSAGLAILLRNFV